MADGSAASLGVTLGSAQEITRHRFSFSGLVAESNTRPYTNSGDPWTFVGDTPEDSERIEEALVTFDAPAGRLRRPVLPLRRGVPAGVQPPVTLADARASIELVAALYHSSRTGEAVTLPLGTDHPLYGGWGAGGGGVTAVNWFRRMKSPLAALTHREACLRGLGTRGGATGKAPGPRRGVQLNTRPSNSDVEGRAQHQWPGQPGVQLNAPTRRWEA